MRKAAPIAALALAAAFLALGVAPASASAAAPCWRTLINDWYDGHIDGTYPLSCYRAALKNMPEDLRIYSGLPSDLNRAMQTIVSQRATQSSGPSTSQPSQSQSKTKSGVAEARHVKKTVRTSTPSSKQQTVAPGPGRKPASGPIGQALDLVSSKPDSLPIPLLVLAGLGLVLVATGTAGMATRRMRARRVRVFPPDEPPL